MNFENEALNKQFFLYVFNECADLRRQKGKGSLGMKINKLSISSLRKLKIEVPYQYSNIRW